MSEVCPHCHQLTFDPVTKECTRCRLRGISGEPILNHVALAGLLHNAQVTIADLGPGSFAQLAGAFSPRPGHDETDGIAFTRDSADVVYQHLRRNGVLCAWVAIEADASQQHSLLLAGDPRGLTRGLRAAKKASDRNRGRLRILSPPLDA